MASMPLEHINVLPGPLATVIFHYSPTQDYAPEFTSMIHANSVDEEIRILRERYKASPAALGDLHSYALAEVDERRLSTRISKCAQWPFRPRS
jgi:DNA phosphorothioation-dependent restriction protein DptH